MKKSLNKNFATTTAATLMASVVASPVANVVFAEEDKSTFEQVSYVENEGETIEGGTIKYALVSEGFAGVLSNMFYSTNDDGVIIDFFNPGLFGYNDAFELDDSGFGQVEFDVEEKTATITIPEGTNWDDGEPLTIDDVIFPYYVLAHPDYDGGRIDQKVTNVVGFDEYNSGDSEEISGLERIDDYTLKVHYKEMLPTYNQANSQVLTMIEPKHILEDIPVTEMEDSDAVRKNPVGFGPFKVESIVPGESVTYTANEHYYRGKPKVDGLVLETVNASTIVQEMRAGNYDLCSTFPEDQYDAWKDAENFTVLSKPSNIYTYIGFKLGTWDEEEETVVMDEDRVVSNKALRQAMAYAIDNDAVGDKFYNGLRGRAKSFITPNFASFYEGESEGYPYDPEKAKEILAEAGFVDNDGDGFVEDPNGEPFTLQFASMSGGDIAQPLAEYYIQAWGEVGINVELFEGRLMEINSFYDEVRGDNPGIDVFQGAIGVGGDPNPNSLWDKGSKNWNTTRFTTPEAEELLEVLNSEVVFDEAGRKEAYKAWDEYMLEELPQIPTLTRLTITPVNNRVSRYSISSDNRVNWHEIELLAEEPISE